MLRVSVWKQMNKKRNEFVCLCVMDDQIILAPLNNNIFTYFGVFSFNQFSSKFYLSSYIEQSILSKL